MNYSGENSKASLTASSIKCVKFQLRHNKQLIYLYYHKLYVLITKLIGVKLKIA